MAKPQFRNSIRKLGAFEIVQYPDALKDQETGNFADGPMIASIARAGKLAGMGPGQSDRI
ncbi:hypothetical protein [Thalassospira marina]|uniref:Uncharacterized protein n=1 Tax=Thalassospira marina TaxID=2048283 RepID=A0A2N3KM96_9PROT|nr:hypothetical protein [Thalassospira marina]PKR51677.1 hypothetical protein COO20_19100 [Thalassospira marina]